MMNMFHSLSIVLIILLYRDLTNVREFILLQKKLTWNEIHVKGISKYGC